MFSREPIECFRRPIQERGARRVEAILDAAAQLIGEAGLDALTVQALADRAQTSKGSLYHFFPDVSAVVRALADRHLCAIREMLASAMQDPAMQWSSLPVRGVVSIFLSPLEYLRAHPDLLAIVRAPLVVDRSAQSMEPLRQFAEFLLARRYPALSDAERLVRAATMVAMVDGMVGYVARCGDVGFSAMRSELACAIEAYLEMPRDRGAVSETRAATSSGSLPA